MKLRALLRHPYLSHRYTLRARMVVRRTVVVCAVILAVAFVTSVTVDLGPALRGQAERAGSNYLQRTLTIGRLGVHLWGGAFVVEDLSISGLTPQSRPFLIAKRIDISMPWSTLFNRRVVFSAIEMTDWQMYVEMMADGRHSFPRFTRDAPPRRSAWTTTLQYVRAYRGEFTYDDHGTPWSTVARNLDVTVARPATEYRGQATFSNGTVKVLNYEPMQAAFSTTFRIVDGKVVLDPSSLETDGASSTVTGVVDLRRWPEQTYQVQSSLQFPRLREIFFARERFSLAGNGEFTGTFHLFKEMFNGRSRTGRELTGTFSSDNLGINVYRVGDLRGHVRWVPETLEISDASASIYGGRAAFTYQMAPLNIRGVPAVATFDAHYTDVNLTTFTNAIRLPGLRLAGRASGRNLLEWPLGRFARLHGDGEVRVEAPFGTVPMTRALPPAAPLAALDRGVPTRPDGTGSSPVERPPFDNHTPREPVPIQAEIAYSFDPDAIILGPSRVATPESYVEFEGRTAYGDQSRIPFHVTSADWLESDRLLAGIMTAFGSPTNAIDIGGSGTFDGVMSNNFRRPRIEGMFTGERLRGFDVIWGSATASVVVENSYADVKNAVVRQGEATIYADGRFSLGYPRRDGGEEINAIVRLVSRPVADLRHAFAIDDYDVDGLLSGEFHVYGGYLNPYGFGNMALVSGVAYGQPFETATSALRFEGSGIRIDNIEVNKGNGRGTGAAYIGWNGTYSFNFDAQRIPVEELALVPGEGAPRFSGLLDFTAGGSGTFDVPRYDVRATIRDLFVGDEGIGQVVGNININGPMMTMRVEAASPRLAVSGSGQIELTPDMHADLVFSVADTSLDPYVRAFEPALSPYTTAIVSGNIRVVGSLADRQALLVDATVDNIDLRFFDYRLRNQAPIRVALDRNAVRVADLRLVGDDTELLLSGIVNLDDQRIAMRANGTANLGILQGFIPNIRSSGRASVEAALEGGMSNPIVTGTMTIDNGRVRHFDLPHALENVSGVVRFDSRSLRLDEVTAQLGGGPIQFGGEVDIEGYRPGRLDVTMSGQNMRLRFPEGMSSLVDADLTLQGRVDSATLGGNVVVRNAVYRRAFESGGGLLDLGAGGGASGVGALPTAVPLRYDVRITVPSTLRIENNTVRLEANADLQLRGTFDRPLLIGRAEVERGDVTFEGRRYVVTRGSIDFNNPTRIEPFFDIETETRVRVPQQTYRVIVRAVGTFDRFTPEFTSDPPLPEVEVLGLLFGDVAPGTDVEFRRYSTVITPEQQLLRERATRALTGALSAEVGRVVEQTFGVDTFQITPSLVDPNAQSSRLDPAARVTIGKRLSDRIYVTYSRSLSASTRDTIVLLEYDQTDRFSWVLSRNEDRTYALDVHVRHVF